MKLVKLVGGLIGVSTVLSFCVTAKAQSNQSFSQCVIALYSGPYSAASAAENCLQVFQGKPTNEDFTTCIDQLYAGPYDATSANEYCKKAYANSVPQPQQPAYPYPTPSGGSPQAISECMDRLMYQTKPVCTRDGSCARLRSPEENANSGFGGWQWQTVRTDMGESTAAQACQNAR